MESLSAGAANALDRLCVALQLGQPQKFYNTQNTIGWWAWRLIRGKPHMELHGGQYMSRWYLLPRNRWLNVYLHRYRGPDPDPCLHDHPWDNVSLILKGGYLEKVLDLEHCRVDVALGSDRVAQLPVQLIARRAGDVVIREATQPHTIDSLLAVPTWTLFATGPLIRKWGFHRLAGWVEFKREDDGS